MIIHPQFIGQEGKEEYVILPINEFHELTELLEDYHDLQMLRVAKKEEANSATQNLNAIIHELELKE
jgi:hypothetical protein